MDLIKSRSEVKVLLEEISHHKTQKQSGANSEEKFPNLLLSSLDKLFEDKQQQLWLVNVFVTIQVQVRVSPSPKSNSKVQVKSPSQSPSQESKSKV